MNILHTVTVKQVITQTSKQALLTQFTDRKMRLEQECDQLYFEQRKVEKAKNNPVMSLQYEKEIEKRRDKIKLVDFKIEQINTLPLGSELKEKEVQAIIEVNIGDNWNELLQEKTIVIKDGVVQQIR
ncbi:YlqD family protein [Metabacillus herbersteinensis]|uniref:YlqD family protein n=1 Tax=Metabacillus herbersteinensis TaxID=283816 RepID=A0ABV6GCH3_9BACI